MKHNLLILTLLALTSALMSACSMFGTKPEPPQQNVCAVWSPIIPSKQDALTDGTATQVLVHNCIGVRLGCWGTPAMKEACSF